MPDPHQVLNLFPSAQQKCELHHQPLQPPNVDSPPNKNNGCCGF